MAIVTQAARARRVTRNPVHTFNIRARPFALTPFFIAPVLPGETLKSLLMQARVVSKPIKDPLVGWWHENYFFYVKHRDLNERETLTEMMLDFNWSPSALNSAADPDWYHGGGINWLKLAYGRIVEEFFRADGEAWDDYLIGDYAAASINQRSWMDSLLPASAHADVDVAIPIGEDEEVNVSEIQAAYAQWEFLRANSYTEMDYEDYLASYGVRTAQVDIHKPELLRYTRNWSYPTNTVDPETGTPSSAMSWSVQERADKDRFFREPGFIVGIQLNRPKVYYGRPTGSAIGHMRGAVAWLPAILANDGPASFVPIADNTILGDITDAGGAVFDVKDLLLYGDQFHNHGTEAGMNKLAAFPAANLQNKYPDATMSAALMVDGTTNNFVMSDGVVNLAIAGQQRDTSRTTVLPAV